MKAFVIHLFLPFVVIPLIQTYACLPCPPLSSKLPHLAC